MTAQVIPLRTSRQFLIQQSVLNAVGRNYPYGVGRWGAAGALKMLERGNLFVLDGFFEQVRMEYRRLTTVYQEAEPTSAFDLPDGFWNGGCA